MSASDLAALLIGVAAMAAVAVLVVASVSLVRTMRQLRQTIDVLREQTVPMVVDLRDAVDQASGELDRVDDILETVESISTTVDQASRLTYRAFSPPLIRTLSVFTGAARMRERLRRGGRNGDAIEVSTGDASATGSPATVERTR